MRHIDTKTAREFAEGGDRYTGAEVRVWVHDLCDNLDALRAKRSDAAGWFALVMNAAASIEDAGNCLQDADARRMAEGAAEHYRNAARNKYASD